MITREDFIASFVGVARKLESRVGDAESAEAVELFASAIAAAGLDPARVALGAVLFYIDIKAERDEARAELQKIGRKAFWAAGQNKTERPSA